jgi:large subunit ribosomal protein L13
MATAKTYSAKPSDVTRAWYVLDASEAPLGRVATKAAVLLTGKEKPMFTQHIDCGDYVIVINAAQTNVTGKKATDKIYYRHSGFPGGIKQRTFTEQMEHDPTAALEHAIRGMLPVNKLRDGRLARLKIYAGNEHNHEAQKPKTLTLLVKHNEVKGDK